MKLSISDTDNRNRATVTEMHGVEFYTFTLVILISKIKSNQHN
jgi:hypothetical protein